MVSIGVFDGIHLGHQAILAKNVERAREGGLVPTVVTFTAHPKEVLLGRAPKTLTSLEHRLELFRRAGVGHPLALAFDERLRNTPAEEFVEKILISALRAQRFVLGFDSKFGRDRSGGPELLERLGYPIDVVPRVSVDQRAVSSTAIREAVELGDLAGAARMLGRAVSVLGTVVRGDGLGRRLGFPTANLDLHHELHPPAGVYACRARRLGHGWQSAVTNIGFRPTLEGRAAARPRIEVHLLDCEEELYGQSLEVEFVAHLRAERRFEGLDALIEQIARDVAVARELLGGDDPGMGPEEGPCRR